MKYVAFGKPDINLYGWDWVYTFTEDRWQNYEFYLIEAKSPKAAREIAVDAFYETAMQKDGLNYIVLYAFEAFCSLELEDEEIVQFLGPKDGKTALEFYSKYTWEAFVDGKIEFYGNFDVGDRDKFFAFEAENLKKLYQRSIRYDILILPITKDFSKKRGTK